MLRRGRMRERHAIWWLIAGTLALIIGVFPQILNWLSELLGVVSRSTGSSSAFAVLFLVCNPSTAPN